MHRRAIAAAVATLALACFLDVLAGDASARPPRGTRLVERGDLVTFYLSDLTGSDRVVQKVQWKKRLRAREDDYVQVTGRIESLSRPGYVVLLIHESSVDRVRYLCPDPEAETCTLTVGEEFQFGGDADRKMRFLVFHDRSDQPFQYRFVSESLALAFEAGVRRFPGDPDDAHRRADVDGVRRVVASGRELLGEFLQDFRTDAPAPVRLVTIGDGITFHTAELVGPERVVQRVRWRQDRKEREADYVQLAAQYDAGDGRGVVMLFVQEPLTERLLARCSDPAGRCTITVDHDFQYGGDTDGTLRFLVFHNRANQPFQHRFVNQTTAKSVAVGAEGLPGAGELSRLGQAVFGDPLRDF